MFVFLFVCVVNHLTQNIFILFIMDFIRRIMDSITHYVFAANSFTLNINNNQVGFETNVIILYDVTIVTATFCLGSSIHTKRTATIIAFSNENEILNLLTLFSRIISLTPLLYSFFLFILCLF